ncbi:amine dehydrogenase large subunit [Pseudohaliea sp.]|uniref:amine dehydrogenase large subunit n=1 Tax=Pseudohaliea sp. TaxID=2740289 RepID=UPI0032EEA764
MRKPISKWLSGGCFSLLLLLGLNGLSLPLSDEAVAAPSSQNKELGKVSPHWVLYFIFEPSPSNSKYILFDADTAEVKAWLSTGYIPSLEVSPDGGEMIVADTWSEGPERLRADYVSFYDSEDYSFSGAIEMPENRRAMMAPQFRTAVVGDGELFLMFTFPNNGITVIDTGERRIINEIDTPGCSLLYPTGERGVSMICGDGSLLTLHLDADGKVVKRSTSEPFFDPDADPVMENAAVVGGTYYFSSYGGDVYEVDLSGEEPEFHEPWSMVDCCRDEPLAGGEAGAWNIGGVQYLTAHPDRGELYALMHQPSVSGPWDHSFPGNEAWVYDLASKKRIRRIPLEGYMNTLYVTTDAEPLLVTSGSALLDAGTEDEAVDAHARDVIPSASVLQVYDAVEGTYLRKMDQVGITYYVQAAPGNGGRQ